jgi:hypothetical protein
MNLSNSQQLQTTRRKLQLLEDQIETLRSENSGTSHATNLTIQSLTRLANQLKEEVARFEAQSPA